MLNDMDFSTRLKEMEKNPQELQVFIARQVWEISKRCPTCQERLDILEARSVERNNGALKATHKTAGSGTVGGAVSLGIYILLKLLGVV